MQSTTILNTPNPTVVDDPEDSIMITTIPDFVTNVSSKPSKGKDKDEDGPSKVAMAPCMCNTRLNNDSPGQQGIQIEK